MADGIWGQLESIVLGVVMFGILCAIGVVILTSLSTSTSLGTNATAVVNTGINTTQNLISWAPTIAVIGIASLVISMIVFYFRR